MQRGSVAIDCNASRTPSASFPMNCVRASESSPTIGPRLVCRAVNVNGFPPRPTSIVVSSSMIVSIPIGVANAFASPATGSSRVRSARSAVRFVNPHAIFPFVPATIPGTPGSETPTSMHSGQRISMRYQMPGAVSIKCMSLPRIARPSFVRVPATANAFEPGVGALSGVAPCETSGFTGSFASRRSITSALGSAAGVQSVVIGASGSSSASKGPRTSNKNVASRSE